MPSGLPLVDEDEPDAARPIGERVTNIVQTSLHDFVDIMVFLILGALIASLTRLLIPQETVATLSHEHPGLAIGLMMALAVVLCLCSEADAFVAASYTTLRPAAKLAFLVLGPMLDFKLYFMYTRVFRTRLIWTIFLSVIVQTFIYSYAVHLIWENYGPRARRCPRRRPRPAANRTFLLLEIFHGSRPSSRRPQRLLPRATRHHRRLRRLRPRHGGDVVQRHTQ